MSSIVDTAADKDKEKITIKKDNDKDKAEPTTVLELLEEDDEFEEFENMKWEDGEKNGPADEQLWQDDWDDDDANDTFMQQLRQQIEQQK